MNFKKCPCLLAAILFALIAIVHGWRFFTGVEITIDGSEFPMWPSIVAMVVGGGMSYWLLSACCFKKCK